ncbi:MAG TPA: MBL fold metallo-hydrolase [Gammaproteobacteria bacterium]|nr:MBL fold metallo-hydrolase [Gammaproteobacteria bacterium]
MKQLYDDLWQTDVSHPLPGLDTHAYFLRCARGNVLFYNTDHEAEIQHIADLGGIAYQYLSHRDEVGSSLQIIKERFGSALCCGVDEMAAIERSCEVDVVFSERQRHFAGIEIIPTPGHTRGSISFLYEAPHGLTYLFTGDTLFQGNGRWETLFFTNAGGSASELTNSLLLYRDIHPDVVISSGCPSGNLAVVEVGQAEWVEAIDENIRRLQQAE